ncbi:aminopeptidase N-like [Lycorma delicatula]|uniref:aminopeptidase N-like n=1 Tax=Lycorma delicatula TaxID=130591 RepID=UPI003F510BED
MFVPVFFIVLLKVSAFCLADDIQLNQNIIPSNYKIKLIPNLESGTFEGQVTIDIDVNSYFQSFQLHGQDLEINPENVYLTRKENGYLKNVPLLNVTITNDIINVIVNGTGGIYIGSYILEITYKGKIRDDMTGFYRSSYIYNGKKIWLGSTQFESTNARKAFPCFDEPHFRTTFTLDVTVSDEYNVISNVKALKSGNSNFNYHFENYPSMPTYLLAWIIYEKYSFIGTDPYDPFKNGTEYRTWAQTTYYNQTTFANQVAFKLLSSLSSYLDVPYTLNKMDLVAIPNFKAGAMENWGLVTFRESRLLYQKGISTTEDLRDIAMVIAHEFTHQWFGNLVTLDWWSYTWLNEAFARYYQYFITLQVYPDWRLDEQFVVLVVHGALAYDSSPHHALTSNIEKKDDISDMFDSVTYNKGASIVRMMEHILTPPNFKQGISKYIKTIASSKQVATPNDLFKILSTETPAGLKHDFESVMKTWTEQSGYPVINVTRNSNSSITVSQKQFLISGDDTSDTKWYVPLTYTDSNEANFTNTIIREWLEPAIPQIEINMTLRTDDWVIFNLQQKGFYRVNYDEQNWNAIINQLHKDHLKIGTLNRAQLLNDAFSLSRAGLVTYNTLFTLTSYLQNEIDYAPWVAAVDGFTYLLNQYAKMPEVFGLLQEYILRLTQPVLNNVGFIGFDGDKMAQKLKRIKVLTLVSKLNHTKINEISNQIFTDLDKTSYSPDIQKSLLCSAIRKSNNISLWNKAYELYNKSQYPTQKIYYLFSLTCSESNETLKTLLDETILKENNTIKREDSSNVFNAIGSSAYGAKFIISYLENNIINIINFNFNNTKIISSIISGISNSIYEVKDADAITEFNNKYKNIIGDEVSKKINTTVETIKAKISWREKNKESIQNILQSELKVTTEKATESTVSINVTTALSTASIPSSTPKPSGANVNTYNSIFILAVLLVTIFCR